MGMRGFPTSSRGKGATTPGRHASPNPRRSTDGTLSTSPDTWNAKELDNNNMDPWSDVQGKDFDALPRVKKERNRRGPPTPDRRRSRSPRRTHSTEKSSPQQPQQQRGTGNPSMAMMQAPGFRSQSKNRSKQVPSSKSDLHHQRRVSEVVGGGFAPFDDNQWTTPGLSSDSADAWNTDSNWFTAHSQSFENVEIPSPSQQLGTVSHPIQVDSDLDSRERDVLKQASRKKKDNEETFRDQDVLARNNSRKQAENPLFSRSQDSSSGNKRGLFRIFGVSCPIERQNG